MEDLLKMLIEGNLKIEMRLIPVESGPKKEKAKDKKIVKEELDLRLNTYTYENLKDLGIAFEETFDSPEEGRQALKEVLIKEGYKTPKEIPQDQYEYIIEVFKLHISNRKGIL